MPEDKTTHAQRRLLNMMEDRSFISWCRQNNLEHTHLYRIALGKRNVSYGIMCSTSHLIPPIEWLFMEDEKLPYPAKTVPQWKRNEPCAFITEHAREYKRICVQLGLDEIFAYRVFIGRQNQPTPALIRACCAIADPLEFFTASEDNFYIPDRGDIISVPGKPLCLALSKRDFSRAFKKTVCCAILTEGDGVEIATQSAAGFALPDSLFTIEGAERSKVKLLDSAGEDAMKAVLKKSRAVFED